MPKLVQMCEYLKLNIFINCIDCNNGIHPMGPAVDYPNLLGEQEARIAPSMLLLRIHYAGLHLEILMQGCPCFKSWLNEKGQDSVPVQNWARPISGVFLSIPI